jgi:hypothetical protein
VGKPQVQEVVVKADKVPMEGHRINYDEGDRNREMTVKDNPNCKARTGINYKVKWDDKIESFPAHERLINHHCQSYDIGYLLHPHFMTMYLRYVTWVFEKAPQYR